ncbi:MAG: nuclear transport factor 2 family protein [Halioglobus sp.]
MKFSSAGYVLLFSVALALQAHADSSPDATLDALHKAGAQADQAAFISLLAKDAVFLGLADGSRLQGQSLRDFINESFAQGKTWGYRSNERQTHLAADGTVAWFEETLEQGQAPQARGRGTGVMVRDGGEWMIVQYNLTPPQTNIAATSTLAPTVGGVASPQTASPGLTSPPADGTSTGSPPKEECRKFRHKTNKKATC